VKPGFSLSDAIAAPFVLIRQRPFSLFAWGLTMAALAIAYYSQLLPIFLNLPLQDGAETAMETFQAESMRLQAASNGFMALMYLVLLVIFNAAGRATLSPGVRDRFLFMRLGMDEVRVAVVLVGAFIGWYIAILVLTLIGVAIGFAAWSFGEAAAVGAVIVYALLVLIVSIAGWARISLMGPATLILRRFAFAEGWTIGRGQVLKLIGMHLIIWVIYVLAYLVLFAVVGAILVGSFLALGLTLPEVIEGPRDLAPLVEPMTGPLLALIPVISLAYGGFIALMAAPAIRAARQLLDGLPLAPSVGADVEAANP
jgi:hypothetical protein